MARFSQLSPSELRAFQAQHPNTILLDVREPWEHELAALADSMLIPLGSVALRAADKLPDQETPIIVYCHHGIRSQQACAVLGALGYSALYNLSGGIDRYSSEVDPTIPTY